VGVGGQEAQVIREKGMDIIVNELSTIGEVKGDDLATSGGLGRWGGGFLEEINMA